MHCQRNLPFQKAMQSPRLQKCRVAASKQGEVSLWVPWKTGLGSFSAMEENKI